ncbi:hypothetical protein [Actinoallomurus iriomotensis]|uniref:hypothetical protein n=1 Tax=Actinoallomurus iriomotensis TaxID=478107 RepID=UPI0025578A20|nr:hypothetical protein [Actinoallomurus iriomotensis]
MSRDRAAFAAWVRTHHPDVGGDPAEFAAGLVRMRAGSTGDAALAVCVFRSRHGLWHVARWLRRRRRGPRVL